MSRLAIISCTKTKANKQTTAGELYLPSTLFSYSIDYARKIWKADQVYILSAKHGLIPDWTIIEPYDEALEKFTPTERLLWASRVNAQLSELIHNGEHQVIILASHIYWENLCLSFVRATGNTLEIPFKGVRLGPKLAWLKKQLEAVK